MSDLRIITPKPGYYTFCLREEYFAICNENHCAAMVLSQHEYWHKNRIDNRQQAQAHNDGEARGGLPASQDMSLWVYKSHLQMQKELLGMFGERAIGQAYKFLTDHGFLETRCHPTRKWDRRPQYLFKIDTVQKAVDGLPSKKQIYEPDNPAESTPQNCGDVAAKLRSQSRNGAESRPQDCGDSKEDPSENKSSKNKKKNESETFNVSDPINSVDFEDGNAAPPAQEGQKYSKFVEVAALRIVQEFRDFGSHKRYQQLIGICQDNNLLPLVDQAVRATRDRQADEKRLGPLERPARYLDSTLVRLLKDEGVHVPRKAEIKETLSEMRDLLGLPSDASPAEIQAALRRSMMGDEDPSDDDVEQAA